MHNNHQVTTKPLSAQRAATTSVRRVCVYFAAPLTTFHTPRYTRLRATARKLRPDAEFIEGATRFRSHGHWLEAWPVVRKMITELIFVTDPSAWIGYGVWTEIADAEADGITVFWLTDKGTLVPLTAVEFGPPNDDDWQRYRRVGVARMRA